MPTANNSHIPVTDDQFKSALETAIKKCRIAKGLKRTPAVDYLAHAIKVGKRRIYLWLSDNGVSPHRRNDIYKDVQEFIRQCDVESPPVDVAPVRPAPVSYTVNSISVVENLAIPILQSIPFNGLENVLKEDLRGEVSFPRWMMPGSQQDYYALELKAPSMNFQVGDLAIVKRRAEISRNDWVVIGENHGYTFMQLSDLVANKDRFTISGVVTAVFHRMR